MLWSPAAISAISAGAAGPDGHGRFPLLMIAVCLVALCVLLHCEALRLLARILPRMIGAPRVRVVILIFGLLLTHMIEIVLFAVGYVLVDGSWKFGLLIGDIDAFDDYVYFSAVVYTTLGFGDLVPEGPLRLLTGFEALTGLVMVGWSTAFTFLHMQRHWQDE
jgi:hypothetical protein